MANRLPPPPREFNWARMLRTLSFWALLIVGTIALVQLASSRRREEAEITYSQFMAGMKKAAIEIDRKVLAELAVNDPAAFGSIVDKVKAQLV